MKRIDLTNDIYYPPIPGLGALPRSALRRLLQESDREGDDTVTAPEAEFRVIEKDEQGRTIVGPWIRPGGPVSGRAVES